jgi:predicted metal-dependent enzyme (double-stranded beta helix superfamily)
MGHADPAARRGASLAPLRDFVVATTAALRAKPTQAQALERIGGWLGTLVARDDWLPEEFATPHPQHYRQYLLHADPQGLFSVLSFVWGPGQSTPVHDHTVWGLIGVLRGQEVGQRYERNALGRLVRQGSPVTLRPGQVDAVSPSLGDIHQVSNAFDDRVSISIHVYGAPIGTVRRHVYAEDGSAKPFVSGYSNEWLPNLWAAG